MKEQRSLKTGKIFYFLPAFRWDRFPIINICEWQLEKRKKSKQRQKCIFYVSELKKLKNLGCNPSVGSTILENIFNKEMRILC